MIELVDPARCTACGACANVCPRDVFDLASDGRPIIARQDDCQTCYLCELYCPADALYVGPDCEAPTPVTLEQVAPLMGRFRRDSGWHEWEASIPNEHWRMGEIFERARKLAVDRQG